MYAQLRGRRGIVRGADCAIRSLRTSSRPLVWLHGASVSNTHLMKLQRTYRMFRMTLIQRARNIYNTTQERAHATDDGKKI